MAKEYSDDDEVTTGVAAEIAGVSHSTLLRYTRDGLITPTSRTLVRGDRRYRVGDARKLREDLRAEVERRESGES